MQTKLFVSAFRVFSTNNRINYTITGAFTIKLTASQKKKYRTYKKIIFLIALISSQKRKIRKTSFFVVSTRYIQGRSILIFVQIQNTNDIL